MTTPAIRATDVTKRYGDLTAVNGISLEVHPGEIFGIIGPNGAGKTTFMECLEGLRRPTSGTIDVLGEDPSRPSTRWRERIGVQLQTAALPPKITVNEAMALFASMYSDPADPTQLLNELGIAAKGRSYVDKLSGGQRQRVSIARALALNPDLIICDEPVSALDVSIQSQILNLLGDLQQQFNLTYVFISHDLSVVRYLSDRVCVMFLGRVCELGVTRDIYDRPLHPYTKFLLEAVPVPDPTYRKDQKNMLTGEIPSPVNPPSGCYFRTRCPYATERCAQETPQIEEAEPGRYVACLRLHEING